ncbi:MAG: 16S rRNA (uracil(1498)-N(3))-methyltransferase [Defluviitaleaceae bacterium]|nr:16S rRNA (uracil(1498)-N(3))-methyltransferase [Defluviitaleaceae bacterium]
MKGGILMHRFFIANDNIRDSKVILIDENAAHANVLRLRVGEKIVACVSDEGLDYICEINEIFKKEVVANIIDSMPNDAESTLKITLFQALPKGNKMNDIIEHAVELGACDITPTVTDRSITRNADNGKISRWQKIAESAAKLSHRGYIPQINNPLTLDEAIKDAKLHDIAFVCYELEKSQSLVNYLQNTDFSQVKSLAFFIGSEGGFADDEVEKFIKNSIPTVSIGKRILRTQSAAAKVLANIDFYLEQIRYERKTNDIFR